MKEFKKLWKKDKRFYLIVILVLSFYTLAFFIKTAQKELQNQEVTVEFITNYVHDVMEHPEKYRTDKKFDEERFYRQYIVEINDESLIRIEDWGKNEYYSDFISIYLKQLILCLFVIQTIRFVMYDSRKEREFVSTLPIKKRNFILYEWMSGIVLYTIPMLFSLIPFYLYEFKLKSLAKENKCWIMQESPYVGFSIVTIIFCWAAILFIYSVFMLMRYLTGSLPAGYLVGIVIFSAPLALEPILDEKIGSNITALINENFTYFLDGMTGKKVMLQILAAILLIVITIVFAEKYRREDNSIFAHKAVKVFFLISIYIWSFFIIFYSMEKIPTAVVSFIAILSAGLITGGTGYLIRKG